MRIKMALRAVVLFSTAITCYLAAEKARANVISHLLSPPNNTNDALQDRSWRLELANQGEPGVIGNVMYGISAFDTLTINGETVNVDRSAWLVFSVTRASAATRTFQGPFGPFTLSGYDYVYTTLTGYSVAKLLNTHNVPDSAMAAIVELQIPYNSTNYLKSLADDTAANKTLLDNAINELNNNSRFIAAFGIVDPQDFYFMQDPNPGTGHAYEFFGLSPLATGPGVDINWFEPLFDEPSQRVSLSQFEFSLRDFMNVSLRRVKPEEGVAAWYTDRGTVLVNVVPEPSSWMALLGLGLTAWALRRRKSPRTCTPIAAAG